jgi:hypothetical protein
VDFENVNLIKKNAVTGLLRKRAKKYDCKGIIYLLTYYFLAESEEDGETNKDTTNHPIKTKKRVQKSSFASAFQSIMNKNLDTKEA